jgi:RHS repeat-associated protein
VQVAGSFQTITAVGGYTVKTTPAGGLTYHLTPPAGPLSVGQDVVATLEVTNTGGTDVPVPMLQLYDAQGANVRLPEDPAPQPGSPGDGRWFLPTSTDAPAGVIPAGYHASIPVVITPAFAGQTLNLVLKKAVAGTPMFWNVFFKEYLRPRGMSADAWTSVFTNFQASVGATSTTYMAALRNAATYLASVGSPVRNADVLLGYLIRQAGTSIAGDTLVAATDAAFPSPGLSLSFSRTFPSSVGGQNRLGRLGLGWTDNWDIRLTSEAGGVPPTNGSKVFLRTGDADREFASVGGGDYAPVYGGEEDMLNFDGTRFVLTGDDDTVTAFRADGQLDYLQDAAGTRITANYDGNGRLTSLAHSGGRALTFTWTTAGQIATVTDPAGRLTTFAYSGQQLTSATGTIGIEKYTYQKNALASVTAPGGVKTTLTYDKLHRLTGRKIGNTQAVTYTYGVGGSVTATDKAGRKATLLADADGLIAAVRGGTGSDLRLTYDANGLVTRVESAAGQVWTTERDEDGHPTAVTDPLGHTMQRTFQGDDVTSVTDARGNTTTFQRDATGRELAIRHPGGGTESFVYDPTGGLVETTNRRGNAIQYLTNTDGQVMRRLFADGSHTDYAYDAHGNLATAADASGTTTLTYLPNDRLQKITYPDGKFLQFTYDVGGRRATSVDQDGFKTAYVYDAAGRLAQLLDGTGAVLVKYTYDKAGREARKDNANGTYTLYSYDGAGRLLTLVNHGTGKTINSQFDYTYDAAGRVGSMKSDGVTTTYDYDAAGQLVAVTTPADAISYTYDAAGNRTSSTTNGVTTNDTVNNRNGVTAAGATTFGYDADGNRTSMTDPSGTTTYTWNDLNQLTGVTSATDTFAYVHDALDQLFTTTHNSLTTTNLNDPFGLGTVAGQYGPGGLAAHYVNGVGLEVRVAAGGSRAFYDFDQLGNVVGLTNASGAYVNQYSYLPFGATTTVQSVIADNPFTFVGRWGVSADGNGLFNMRARSYDPVAGGFVSDDPLGFAGGDFNIRRYAGNDPVNLIDPSGLKCDDDELRKLQKKLDQANDGLHNAITNYELSKAFTENVAFQFALAANNPLLFTALTQINDFSSLDDQLDMVGGARKDRDDAQKALDACKKQKRKSPTQPPKTFTTPNLKAHAPGGLDSETVVLV